MSKTRAPTPISLSQREPAILYQLVRDLTRSADVGTIADHLFTRARSLLGADYGLLALANAEGTELKGVAGYGLDLEIARQEQIAIHASLGPVARAFQQKQPVIVPHFSQSSLFSERLRANSAFAQDLWAVPLMSGEKAIGVLILGALNREVCSEDLHLLQLLGDEAALAIERVRLADELRESKKALQRSEEYFRLLIEHASDDITIVNADGTTRYESPSVEWMLGYKPEELIGTDTLALIHPDDQPKVLKALSTLAQTPDAARAKSVEFRCRHKNGSWRILEATGSNLLDNPVVKGFVLATRDITSRKQTEEALRQERNFVSAILATVGALVVVTDREGRIVRFNRTCEQVTGYSFDEVQNKQIGDFLLPAEERESVQATVEKLLSGDFPNEHESHWVAKDGSRRRISWSNTVLLNDAGVVTHVIGTGMDITANRQTQELLHEDGQVSAALARVGQELISSLNTPVILERLCRLTAEVLESDYSHTTLWKPAEDAYVVVAGYGEPPEQAEARRTFRLPRATFSRLVERLKKEEILERHIDSLHDPLPVGVLRRTHTSTVLWMPLRRGTEIIGFQSASYREHHHASPLHQRIARGISQLASFALANAQLFEELDRANRLKEDFVGSVSHELRTPLNIILGYSELLREETFGPLTAEQLHPLARIEKSARELSELINTTLDLSRLQNRRQPLNIQNVNIVSFFTELAVDIRHLMARSSLQVDWRPEADLPPFHTDPIKLRMILKNLIINALKFTDKGSVTIEARHQNAGIMFSVRDTGIGIAPEALALIFEPFRQAENLHPQHQQGVGLGLYIVRQLVDLLGGTVAVESEVGKGSTFHVWLPLYPDHP